MSIVLSQNCIDGLKSLGNSSERDISQLSKYFLQMLLSQNSSISIDPAQEGSLCSISTVYLEATKFNLTPEQLNSLFVEYGIPEVAINTFTELYAKYRETLRNFVGTSSFSTWEIVDLDWRIDFVLVSRHCGRENMPIYLLSLKVMDRGLPRMINMSASEEELQDLLSKVRDAVKQADRVMTSIPDI